MIKRFSVEKESLKGRTRFIKIVAKQQGIKFSIIPWQTGWAYVGHTAVKLEGDGRRMSKVVKALWGEPFSWTEIR